MTYTQIQFEITEEKVAIIRFGRPQVMNALNKQMREEITHAFKRAEAEARVVVMTGSGRSFCSGQDLADGGSMDQLDMESTLRDEYEPMLMTIYDCKIPTISAVNGSAVGAGANLALAADVVIATASAVFAQAFTKIGLIPDAGGTYWLPRQIGSAKAMGAALFGEPVTAQQASDWGMIWEAVEDAAFEQYWMARAVHLAKGPTAAYARVKESMRGSFDNTLPEQLAVEAKLQGECGQTHDFKEGVTAFLQKRPAKYLGK